MKSRMTNKQKLALWGLVKHPALNDRETADKIKMKLSTLTTIRYKMLSDNYYKTVNVPIVNTMGYEILAFMVLRLHPSKKGAPLTLKKNDFPNLVYIAHDPNRLLAFGFYPDYSSAETDLQAMAARLQRSKAIARSGHWWRIISLKNNDVPIFFEMSPFVNKGLGLNRPEATSAKGSMFNHGVIHLSSFERKVLREIIAHPDETDVQISKNLKITRSTVARIRDRLLDLAYKPLNIVDLRRVGYKGISLASPTLAYSSSGPRQTLLKAAMSIDIPLFLTVGNDNAVLMTPHKDLKGIRSRTNSVFRSGAFKGHMQDPVHIATFNLKQLNVIRNHEYLPLVEQALDNYEYKPKKRKKAAKKRR